MRHPTAIPTTTMTAAAQDIYGPAEVVQLRQLPTPSPKPNEVLVRVRASTVGPAHVAFRSGRPWFARLYSGLRRPKLSVLGDAFAGDIASVGADVRRFEQDTRVFGLNPKTLGCHAEYVCVPEDGLLAPMIPHLSYDDAASVLEVATSLTFLRDVAKLRQGQRILINGASGAVGVYAVQLAKHYGAHVTGVCGARNVGLVASLGADEVIDYTTENFTANGQQYDVIFDAVATSSFSRCKSSLTPKGLYLSTVPTPGVLTSVLWTAMGTRRKAKFAPTGLMQTEDNLALLGELFATGEIRPVIDRHYPLEQIADAHRYVQAGHKTGSVVITI